MKKLPLRLMPLPPAVAAQTLPAAPARRARPANAQPHK